MRVPRGAEACLPRLLEMSRVVEGSRFLLSENPGEDLISFRVFEYQQPFYSRFEHRRQQFVLGERPQGLVDTETIDQRIWEKHQTYLRRLSELVRLQDDEEAQFSRLRQMLEETGSESNPWEC